jgi:amidohydrolase
LPKPMNMCGKERNNGADGKRAVLKTTHNMWLRLCLQLLLALWFLNVPAHALASDLILAEARLAVQQQTDRDYQFLETLYRYLHAHPELSFQERDTSARLATELKNIGFDVTANIGGHGVVGMLKNGKGPVLMIRTDMDALPITEETGLPYASRVRARDSQDRHVGVMHACGHDMHMTVFVGTARALMQLRGRWSGTLMMVAQPAEEKGAGAKAMLEDGLFTRFPVPDYGLALHVAPDLPAGKVGYCEEYAMANVDSVDITLNGVGGHGAAPDKTKDPVVMAAELIMDLQTIVSREINPIEPAVVTVGSVHAGTKHNIIPDTARLQLTVRSFSEETRSRILTAIKRKAEGVAHCAGAPAPSVNIKADPTPALHNDPRLTKRLATTFEQALGPENVIPRDPEMIGEDFARYGRTKENLPIFMFRLGTADGNSGGKEPQSLHSSRYAPVVEASLRTGVFVMAMAALELLESK